MALGKARERHVESGGPALTIHILAAQHLPGQVLLRAENITPKIIKGLGEGAGLTIRIRSRREGTASLGARTRLSANRAAKSMSPHLTLNGVAVRLPDRFPRKFTERMPPRRPGSVARMVGSSSPEGSSGRRPTVEGCGPSAERSGPPRARSRLQCTTKRSASSPLVYVVLDKRQSESRRNRKARPKVRAPRSLAARRDAPPHLGRWFKSPPAPSSAKCANVHTKRRRCLRIPTRGGGNGKYDGRPGRGSARSIPAKEEGPAQDPRGPCEPAS